MRPKIELKNYCSDTLLWKMPDKILIVDDVLETRKDLYERIYQESIKENWYELVFAVSGERALEIIEKDKKQEIALIILDLQLDGAKLNGIQFANKLASSQINKKIIVWTAYPEWENSFSEEAKSLILTVCNRTDYPFHYLKTLSDTFMLAQHLEPPGKQTITSHSKLVGYQAIRHLAKSLPSEQLYKLVLEIIRCLPLSLLGQLKQELSTELDSICQSAIEQNKLIELIATIQAKGLLQEIIPAKELNNPWLEIIERKYLDYWLHDGTNNKFYISKKIVREFFPIELQKPHEYLGNPNEFNFDDYRARYYRARNYRDRNKLRNKE